MRCRNAFTPQSRASVNPGGTPAPSMGEGCVPTIRKLSVTDPDPHLPTSMPPRVCQLTSLPCLDCARSDCGVTVQTRQQPHFPHLLTAVAYVTCSRTCDPRPPGAADRSGLSGGASTRSPSGGALHGQEGRNAQGITACRHAGPLVLQRSTLACSSPGRHASLRIRCRHCLQYLLGFCRGAVSPCKRSGSAHTRTTRSADSPPPQDTDTAAT